MIEGQCIESEVDHSLNRVLNWNKSAVNLTRGDRIKHIRNRSHRNEFACCEITLGSQSLLGEGPEWAEKRDARSRTDVACRTIR